MEPLPGEGLPNSLGLRRHPAPIPPSARSAGTPSGAARASRFLFLPSSPSQDCAKFANCGSHHAGTTAWSDTRLRVSAGHTSGGRGG